MRRFIDLRIFIVSLALGVLFVYLLELNTKTVHMYPSPENWEKYMIKDKSQQCYKYVQNEVSCPSDSSKLTKFPVQD